MLTRILPASLLTLGLASAAQAQINVPLNAITLISPTDQGCSIAVRELYASGGEMVFRFANTGSTWITFSVLVQLSGTGYAGTARSAYNIGARAPGVEGVVRLTSVSPALPAMLSNATATVNISGCVRAPNPNDGRRNTQ